MADTWDINTNQSTRAIQLNTSGLARSSLSRSSSILSYPLKRDDVYQGRIRFTVKKAKRMDVATGAEGLLQLPVFDNVFSLAGFERRGKSDDDLSNAEGPAAFAAEQEKQKQIQDSTAEGKKMSENIAAAVKGVKFSTDTKAPLVDLYMPAGNIVMNEGVDYGPADLNPMGMTAAAGLAAGDSLIAAFGKGLGEGFNSIFGLNSNMSNSDVARLAVGRLANKLPSGVAAAGQLAVQATANPNSRALFRNVNLREFNFTFKFIATSPSEAREVQAIIRHFRREMYPSTIPVGDIPIGYNFPNAFGIEFKYKGTKAKIPKIETCYLRNLQTSYNPTSSTFHTDGQPNEIDLTLNFIEVRTLNQEDIDGEFG